MPLLKPFSSAILRRAIREEVGDASSVLDVSCGDDELIVSLAAEGRDCVANDVCLNLMKARAGEGAAHDVVYTLHNVVQLPFAKRFEAAVCKNTVHHLNDAETARAFAELDRLADEVVIVDVLDISASARAKAFNAYYRLFLGDQGRHFLSFKEFSDRISTGFPERSVSYRQITTVKGCYALAHVI
jgi:ubiquinone/menaquinone biosynthesis C-methylase UbiE